MHPGLEDLMQHSVSKGIGVEVFSNLIRVTESLWDAFSNLGVLLATSYYSDSASEHESITGRVGSYSRTREGILEALRRGIPLRVGVVGVRDNQHINQAVRELQALGVDDIGVDFLREVGRGQRDEVQQVSQLCGRCASGVLAVGPDGVVWPCVFSRWLPVGNVTELTLEEIMRGEKFEATHRDLANSFISREEVGRAYCLPDCSPALCGPFKCRPGDCSPLFCRPGVCTPNRCGPR
jgi:MoaA/NifB/PqqE/SkfB family radical SAM enzyme